MVSMHSRCGKILDLVDIERYRTSLVDFDLRILSLASPLYPLYIRNGFLVVKPGILLAYAVTDDRLVKLVGNGFNVSRDE